jgi:hypothetical protein
MRVGGQHQAPFCVSIALVIQHVNRMRRILLSYVVYLTLNTFSHIIS